MNPGKILEDRLTEYVNNTDYINDYINRVDMVRSYLQLIIRLKDNKVFLLTSDEKFEYIRNHSRDSILSYELNINDIYMKYKRSELYYLFQTKDRSKTPNIAEEIKDFILLSLIGSGNRYDILQHIKSYTLKDSKYIYYYLSSNKLNESGVNESLLLQEFIKYSNIKPLLSNNEVIKYLEADLDLGHKNLLICKLNNNFKFSKKLIKEFGRDYMIEIIRELDNDHFKMITLKEIKAIYKEDKLIAIEIMKKVDLVVNNLSYFYEVYKSEFTKDLVVNCKNIYVVDLAGFFKEQLKRNDTRKALNALEYLSTIINLDKIVVSGELNTVIDIFNKFKDVDSSRDELYQDLISMIYNFKIDRKSIEKKRGLVSVIVTK